jgi:hypothetical protein
MTISEIQAFVVSVDPNSAHYYSDHRESDAYTEWREIRLITLEGDDACAEEAWVFQIDRFTKDEHDEIAAALLAALKASTGIAFRYFVTPPEPDTGYIHHIYDCEG